MKISFDERCSQLIILVSTLMLALSGIIGIEITKYCLYLIVGLGFIKILFLKLKPIYLVSFVIIMISSLWIMLTYGGTYANFLIFLTSIVFAISVVRNGISNGTWKLVKVCTYIVCLALIVEMLLSSEYSVYGQLTLYFDNPNMAGIALCAPAMMLVLMIADEKKKSYNIINWLLLAVMIYMIYMTQNRASLFSLLLVLVAALLVIYPKQPLRISSQWFFAVLKLTPIIVMFIYIAMYNLLPSNIELLGKPLFSGREGAWMSALGKIINNPFAYYNFKEGTLNLFLEGAARYGIFSMLGYFIILISFGKSKNEIKEMSAVSYIAYVAFHLCLLQQSFESTMITGSYSVYIWSYLLLGIASMKPQTANNEKVDNESIEGISKI